MALKLVVTTNVNGDVFELPLKKSTYRVGRRRDNDLRIKETYVSGYHSELNRNAEGEYELKDCGSSNGTFLNGLKVEKPTVVKAGDFIKFGILKVAVMEESAVGPKVVSLKDRPAFARKREEMTASIPATPVTSKVGVISGDEPEPIGGPSSGDLAAELKEAEALLDEERKRVSGLEAKLARQQEEAEALSADLDMLRADLAEKTDALGAAESARQVAATGEEKLTARLAELEEKLAASEEGAKSAGEKSTEAVELAKAESSKLATELAEATRRAKAAEKQLADLEQERDSAASEISSLKNESGSTAEALAAAEKKAEALQAKLEEAEAAIAAAQAKAEEAGAAAADERKTKDGEIVSLRDEAEQLRKELAEKNQALAETAGRLEDAAAAELAASKQLDAKLGEADQLSSETEELRKQVVEAEKRLAASVKATEALEKKAATAAEKAAADLRARDTKLESLEAEAKTLRQSLSGKETSLKQAAKDAAKLAALATTVDQLKSELSLAGKESKSISAERAKLEKDLARAEAALAKSEDSLAKKAAEAAEREKALAALESDLAELRKSEKESATGVEALTAEKQTLADRLAAAEARIEESAATIAELSARAEEKESEATTIADGLEKERAALAEASRERDEAAARAQELEAELTDVRTSVDEARGEAERLHREIESARAEGAAGETAAAKRIEELEARLAQAESVAETGGKERTALEKELAEAKAQCQQQADDLQKAKAEANELRIDLRKTREKAASDSESVVAALHSKVASLETALAAEKVLAGSARSKHEDAGAQIEKLASDLEAAKEESASLRARIDEVSRTNGRLQAELNKESANAGQLGEDLDSAKSASAALRLEIEALKKDLAARDREIAAREQQDSREESDAIVELKRGLGEALFAAKSAEEAAEAAKKEKLALSGSFDRLRVQLEEAGQAGDVASVRYEELLHEKSSLARRLEKAEASNAELAARIKEDASTALANKSLIEKLETQLRENEFEAVQREQQTSAELRADVSRLQREGHARDSEIAKLRTNLENTDQARRSAEEKALRHHERIVELESEADSARKLLADTERRRAELSSLLEDQTELAESRARTIGELKTELADTIARAKASEETLLAKHRDEIDVLDTALRQLREAKAGLEKDLEDTRVGMSEALRQTREQAEADKVRLINENNAKLSNLEADLSAAIRSREESEAIRNEIEDELNERDERIERLSETIEDLELRIVDERETTAGVRREFETTKAGLSQVIAANLKHLGLARENYDHESEIRTRTEGELDAAHAEIEELKKAAEEAERRFQDTVKEWEDRYDQLREEKLTLATEDANLKRIREEIETARDRKQELEKTISDLGTAAKQSQTQYDTIKEQKEALVRDREELKAGLKVTKSELETVQQRCAQSNDRERKLAATIEAAEKRIQSLKKLEAEMEQAFERKRQQGILSRGEIFSGTAAEAVALMGEASNEEFYRKLIAKLDLIDDLSKRYENRWRFPKLAEQLLLLKGSFLDLLEDHAVREFRLEPGTVLSIEERKRIKLVPPSDANGVRLPANKNGAKNGSQVVQTIRPGYVLQNGGAEVIIRKAEVVVA